MLRWLVIVIVIVLAIADVNVSAAADLPRLTPAEAGLRAEKLAEIDGLVAAAIADKKLPGCVVQIGRAHV